jgi:hypothetical protein
MLPLLHITNIQLLLIIFQPKVKILLMVGRVQLLKVLMVQQVMTPIGQFFMVVMFKLLEVHILQERQFYIYIIVLVVQYRLVV